MGGGVVEVRDGGCVRCVWWLCVGRLTGFACVWMGEWVVRVWRGWVVGCVDEVGGWCSCVSGWAEGGERRWMCVGGDGDGVAGKRWDV